MTFSRVLAYGLAAAGLFVGFSACGSDSSDDGNADPVDAGNTDAATYGSSACAGCVDGVCGNERSACALDPTCASWLSCLADCPLAASGNVDTTCSSACPPPSTSEGEALRQPYAACVATAASGCVACGVSDAGSDAPTDSGACVPVTDECPVYESDDQCIKCMRESCCDWYDKVGKSSGEGYALTACISNCDLSDHACYDACIAANPDGIPAWGGFTGCYQATCDPPYGCADDTECGRCMYRECGCEYQECLADTPCFLAFRCMQTCNITDPNCVSDCIAAHPGAETGTDKLSTCIGNHCLPSCGGGP